MNAIDLFSGAGGFSTGAQMAGCKVVWAGNHWQAAVDTHALNHPSAVHVCQDLHQADWRAVPRHDILLASPACQGHSPARGKEKPHHDAMRSTAWAVVSAIEYHLPEFAVVENVPDFMNWKLFSAWCGALYALGYAIAPHLIDSADHGAPQHRKRIYLVISKSKHPLQLNFPKRTHVPASSIIDFKTASWSQIEKPGRSVATLDRIKTARKSFGSRFVMPYYGSGSGLTGRAIERPIGTITTRDRWAVVDGDRMRMLSVQEARAAMGFPVDYKLPENKRTAMHMLGNAVVPLVARDIIREIARVA